VAFATGGAFLATGAILFFAASRTRHEAAFSIHPALGPRSAELAVGAAF
jgi:hypothetical protein